MSKPAHWLARPSHLGALTGLSRILRRHVTYLQLQPGDLLPRPTEWLDAGIPPARVAEWAGEQRCRAPGDLPEAEVPGVG